jgi:hypothetical protein
VVFASEQVLEVGLPAHSQSRRDAMIEMQAYLRVWQAMYPGHEVKRVEEA